MKIVLTVFAPLLVAIGIRLALLLLELICAVVCEILDAIDIISYWYNSVKSIGEFDTFDWEESWFYWVLVIIGSFIAEYIIWSED